MPYIKQEYRKQINKYLDPLISDLEKHHFVAGELNYTITKILHAAWEFSTKYETGNAIIGVLECAKQEFYRRQLASYEDEKIKENGDI